MQARQVTTPSGYVSVVEHGRPDDPHVVLVHGYPDSGRLWDRVVGELDTDHHVTVYDVRGAGSSARPRSREAYTMRHLLADLGAVIDATADDRPVHLVGHDWGAIQGFAALRDPGLAARMTSFTAISAPGLEMARAWVERRLASRTPTHLAELAGQAARSWYLAAFQLPVVPELVMRGLDTAPRLLGRRPPAPFALEDAITGLALYRANRQVEPDPAIDASAPSVPTQVVTGRRDRFVSPRLFDDLRALGVPVTELDAGHWLPRTHPADVAAAIRGMVGGR